MIIPLLCPCGSKRLIGVNFISCQISRLIFSSRRLHEAYAYTLSPRQGLPFVRETDEAKRERQVWPAALAVHQLQDDLPLLQHFCLQAAGGAGRVSLLASGLLEPA